MNHNLLINGLLLLLFICLFCILLLLYEKIKAKHKIEKLLKLMQKEAHEREEAIQFALNESSTALKLATPSEQKKNPSTDKILFLNRTEQILFNDITEKTQKTYQTLLARLKNIKLLSYSIAHDLRQPLKQAWLSAQEIGDERAIKTAIKQANELIDGYMALAEMEAHEPAMQMLDLQELIVSESKKIKKNNAFSEKYILNIEPLTSVWGDALLVRQVFWNLLTNAIKYGRGEEILKIDIRFVSLQQKDLLISISDNGTGFSPLLAEKIFLPFFRENTSKKNHQGLGIGLSLCREIMQKMGGEIWAKSDEQSGAAFFLRFKLSPD